jgi:ubiquinone/menaquinone biosynthesis C-methylase UbiE
MRSIMTDHLHGPSPAGLTRRIHRAHETMFGLAGHAGWYDRGPGRLARPLYRRIAADVAGAGLPEGAVVLDIGTGPGRVPLLVARRCPGLVVEGVDLSAEMIERATRTAAEAGASAGRLTYRVADVRTLPHADGSVDLVVSSLSLHHWVDVPAGLAEIRRVLRPGAEAWIYDVRPVLGRVAASGEVRDMGVTVQPLASDRAGGAWRLLARIAGRFIARMTVPAAD